MKTITSSACLLAIFVFPALVAPALAPNAALAQAAPMRATQPPAQTHTLPQAAKPVDEKTATEKAAPEKPAAAKPAPVMARGKVLETMDASSYTYARVETPAGEQWIAGPQTPLKVGDTVEWQAGMVMPNFTSKSLSRTFESLSMVDRIVVAATPAGGAGAAADSPHAALSSKEPAGAEPIKVARADGGVTVAEVYNRRAELDGKEVVVRGKVVKFNSGIMERNWLHLRDGTEGTGGENDLTVTSDERAAVGDTVVVRGTVVLNKDFGFNYRYDVMVERAKVTVE